MSDTRKPRPDLVIFDDVQDPTHPPHKWYSPMLVPVCIYCGVTSVQALVQQPETKGVGPCQERLKAMLEEASARLPK